MSIGLIGRKVGMTRVFTDAGVSMPVTVVHAPANCVIQAKSSASDGYVALQMAAGECKESKINKPMAGHFKKAGVSAKRSLREFRITEEELRSNGDSIGVDSFKEGEKVNVVGVSKGKGFAGVVKRYHFKTQDATHGNSLSHRAPGSIGQCQTPGKVFKGKKMAGHMGNERVTTKNLTVVKIDKERELLLIRGAVPGSRGGEVLVNHLIPVPPPEVPEEKIQQDEVQSATEQAAALQEDTKENKAEVEAKVETKIDTPVTGERDSEKNEGSTEEQGSK